MLASELLAENDVKTDVVTSKDFMHESRLTPSCKMAFHRPGWVHGNAGRVCENIKYIIIYFVHINCAL